MSSGHGGATPLQIDEKEFEHNPHALYDVLRSEAPVREIIAPGGTKVWLVTRYDDAKSVLTDNRLSKNIEVGQKVIQRHTDGETGMVFASELAAHMMNADPPDHTRLRKQVNKVFTQRAVEKLGPRIEEITTELLDAMEGHDEVDLMRALAYPLPMAVICELLGVPADDQERFKGWVPTQLSGGDAESMAKATMALLGYLHELIESKRSQPADDLLTGLVRSSDDGKLNTQELVSMAFLLLVAGNETTVNLIGNGVYALLRHPDQLAALRADRSLMPGAVDELLRYESPVNTSSLRFTTEPIEVGGVVIPEGELVVVALTSANRDESQFPDAGSLDIHRQAGASLSFGHGIHYCVGAQLARLEAQIAFDRLIDRFPHLRLAADPDELRWQPGTALRGLRSLPVSLGAARG
ncbi:cytochrome P450 [Streptomyces sp. Tu 3180]|uniref:cytochrome P450 family protein n=1 Tax=Streptomyces sp. Tu 3180 TaxID=2682611 RepID=UPI00135A326F|nr:cytochrome P450 [Streptomyces sp. Tu 3180]KAF3469291.1 cytochrome P450 [Streptomyces sp. Tu 3180]